MRVRYLSYPTLFGSCWVSFLHDTRTRVLLLPAKDGIVSSPLSPNYIIPVGTQVVLKRDHAVVGPERRGAGERMFKKAGSVGVIEQAPITNDDAYLLDFADGYQVRAKRDDLTVLRSDAPASKLGERELIAYEPHLIYLVTVGSRAYGLADAQSDRDERGIYLPPAAWHWSLQPLPEQIEFKRTADHMILDHNIKADADDVCWWELEKFVRLALKANPTALEVLYVPERHILQMDDIGERLWAIRSAFLSQHVYQTYSGYVLSQFRRMKKHVERHEPHRPKHAMHLIRLLHSGIAALEGRGILVDVGEHRDELLRMKHERIEFEAIYQRALALDRQFQEAFSRTDLPERPDVEAVDAFLIWARRQRT